MREEGPGMMLPRQGTPPTPDEQDLQVAAVLEVLGGGLDDEVAHRRGIPPQVLRRWVRTFIAAGAAAVRNRPQADLARQRDRFLAAVAHELRTPLAVAQGWTTMLRDGEVPPAMVSETYDRLRDALDRLNERSRDIELLAKVSLDRLDPAARATTAGELCARLPGLSEIRGDGPSAPVVGDPDLLQRLLRDLWEVAGIDPAPERVELEVGSEDGWTEFRIRRYAAPIPDDVVLALFDPFDVNDDDSGVTLGLYLARALAAVHGGTIGLEQRADEARLWVRLPQAQHAAV